MSKEKNDVNQVDVFVVDELDSNKKLVKSVLTIPCDDLNADLALRVEQDSLYASTRLGTLQLVDEGYQADVTGKQNLPGKKYTLHQVGGKLVQSGKIQVKKAEARLAEDESKRAKVVELPKTGTGK